MLVVLAVIPTTLVHELTKNLDGRLGTVLFDFWHVEIIDEDDSAFRVHRAEVASATLLKRVVNNVLHLVAVGLRRETDLNGVECLFL